MLSVVPTVQRCSVRSVATAAKAKPQSQPTTSLGLSPERAAALAQSKWAPKPKPEPSPQAGPSTPPPSVTYRYAQKSCNTWATTIAEATAASVDRWETGPSTPAKGWARLGSFPEHSPPPASTFAASSAASTPKAGESSGRARWASAPSDSAASLPEASPTVRVGGSSTRERWPSSASTVSDTAASRASSTGIAGERSVRSRWPSFASTPSDSSSRSRGSRGNMRPSDTTPSPPPVESRSAPRTNFVDPATASPRSSGLPHRPPPHLQWQPPVAAAVPAPASSTSTSAPPSPSALYSGMDKILPRTESPPNSLSQNSFFPRDVAPHLAPRLPSFAPRPPISPQIPAQKASKEDSPQRGSPAPKTYMDQTPNLEGTDRDRTTRPKHLFKERGSLLKADIRQEDKFKESQPKSSAPKVKKPWAYVEKRITEDVYIPSTVSVGHLARLLNVRLDALQDKMYEAGMGAQASFDYVLSSDYAVLLAEEFGRTPIVNDEAAFDLYPPAPHPNPETLPNRPPVVTIMGHVDHGKTTLLDTLRSASVAQGEVGGITQHIGAFSVPVPSASGTGGPQSITFLDTPGHAAFSAMRARGAQVTDIIVLVVAADDGIMPQTREVIELIKKDREKIGVVVAINKIDKPGCDVDAVQKALLVEDIHVEELGGDTPSVEVSGLTGKGLPDLVETLSLIAEIQDLRAEPEGIVFGYVLESKVVKGLGAIATVLVLRGCLKPGSHIVSGVHHAKVRLMQDSNGKSVKTATPGMAITVSGWKSVPDAGDEVLQGTESEIKRAIANRQRKADIEASLLDIEAINSSRQHERELRQAEAEAARQEVQVKPKEDTPTGPKELRLVIKADVSGSAEAVEGALEGIGNHLAITKVISSSVGDIQESDIMMAKAVGGTIVGFSVSSNRTVEALAARNGVPLITSDIIYRLMEDVKARIITMLPVIIESRVLGEAKVLQLFDITLKGKQMKKVAGSRVVNGLIEKTKVARVMRDGNIIHEGSFETMRHFKKEVTEIRKGNECGLNLAGFDDLRVDDVIQTYEVIEKPGLL